MAERANREWLKIGMATLNVRRARDSAAVLRRMAVLLDGRPVARLKRGASHRLELAPGRHEVQAQMDWTRSEVLPICTGPDDEVTVEVAIEFSAVGKMWVRPSSALDIRLVGDR